MEKLEIGKKWEKKIKIKNQTKIDKMDILNIAQKRGKLDKNSKLDR